MKMKSRIKKIDTTWKSCKYRYMVFLTDCPFAEEWEVLDVLRQMFGEAVFFDRHIDGTHVYLCRKNS